ncbi:MAG: pitrilysin family protein [Acidobacteriota bacterium]|jgi:predicted Zn-dependent peptidase
MRPKRLPSRRNPALALAVLLLLASSGGFAQDLQSFEERTTTHVLDNGWTFIIVERPVAPVFSFATIANVGTAQEVPGITGLAHFFEHMAFKGTPNIGTKNYKAEQQALDRLEDAYQAWQDERLSPRPDPEELRTLEARFRERQEEAASYVVANEFGDIIDREGGVGLNAGTGSDETIYYYSLPSNKLELFAFLESERFLHPVFREFYKERDVVMEEKRRAQSNPVRRLLEQFKTAAFEGHPYHHPGLGYMSDLQSLTMSDARAFFETYYVPSNLVTTIVGDVKAEDVIPVLEKYFGRIPAGPNPPPLRTVEPPQIAEKTVVLEDASQPIYIEGYKKGSKISPEQPIYDAIDDILSNGRTGRLYRSLVRDQKLAVQTGSFSGYPGERYPNLQIFFAVPAREVTNEEVQAAIREELERLRTEDVTDEELARFKTRAKADLIRSMRSNQGMANNLAEYQRLFGDWREAFRYLDRLDAVTKEDIRRVANETFRRSNRTVGMIVTETAETAGAAAAPASAE